MTSIPLFLSQEHPCSYLDHHTAQCAFVHPSFPLTTSIYSFLVERGFRRSGNQVYSPHCSLCCACVPVRIAVNAFHPSRNQKRTLAKNRNTETRVKAAIFNPEHYAMYQHYQQSRHKDGSMAQASQEQYLNFLSSEWCDTLFVEFLIENKLAAVAIVDQLSNALSAVYTFFDPMFSDYSPGNYAILWQIKEAQRQQREWLYLGFWIADCQKMSYKSQYRPIQGYINNQWQDL